MFSKIQQYLQEVMKEVRKVNWPNRKSLINNTILVLIASLIISLTIFAQDQIISTILEFIYQ